MLLFRIMILGVVFYFVLDVYVAVSVRQGTTERWGTGDECAGIMLMEVLVEVIAMEGMSASVQKGASAK